LIDAEAQHGMQPGSRFQLCGPASQSLKRELEYAARESDRIPHILEPTVAVVRVREA